MPIPGINEMIKKKKPENSVISLNTITLLSAAQREKIAQARGITLETGKRPSACCLKNSVPTRHVTTANNIRDMGAAPLDDEYDDEDDLLSSGEISGPTTASAGWSSSLSIADDDDDDGDEAMTRRRKLSVFENKTDSVANKDWQMTKLNNNFSRLTKSLKEKQPMPARMMNIDEMKRGEESVSRTSGIVDPRFADDFGEAKRRMRTPNEIRAYPVFARWFNVSPR